MTNPGMDYGLGQTNIDKTTGIRFGVISAHDVGQTWWDESEGQYGDAHCPECEGLAVSLSDDSKPNYSDVENWERPNKHECDDYACPTCEIVFGSEAAFPEEAISFTYENDGYVMEQSRDDSDIFVIKSPYYTRAQFCSPCAPGAGYLVNPTPDGPKTYCLHHDWFEDGKAPYPVYKVEDDTEVLPE